MAKIIEFHDASATLKDTGQPINFSKNNLPETKKSFTDGQIGFVLPKRGNQRPK